MNGVNLKRLVESHTPAEFHAKLTGLLDQKKIDPDDISYHELAWATGVLDDLRGKTRRALQEANPVNTTSLFPVVTTDLLHRQVLRGYNSDEGWIGRELVTVQRSRTRNLKMAGLTSLAGPLTVDEGHPYEESTFDEKFVTTEESKKGRILSITEELLQFDQTGEINRRARAMGFYTRQDEEKTIVRGVMDVNGNVFRPGGVAEPLYATDGSNKNYVGVNNTTHPDFDAAVALEDWESIDHVRQYRALALTDDRIDGDPEPIMAPMRQLLCSEQRAWHARRIINATEISTTSGDHEFRTGNPVPQLRVLHSPYVDAVDGDDWYVGDFKRQFVWVEIWPIQTFMQRADSEAAFERDVVLRVKSRYYGGLAATDSLFVTKVDGA